jgi:HK97 family phage major capsid protein
MEENLIQFGDAIKATRMDDGNVKLAGYLVRFGDASKTDVTGDYFTKDTDFGSVEKSDGWFNHRMPVDFDGKRVVYDEQLPDVKLSKDDTGIFAEIVLGARNEYERIIADLGFEGKLGWSSGTAPHLVDRKQVGNAFEITRWKLGLDASLTPTPAEPRNKVIPIKSLMTHEAESSDKGDEKNKTGDFEMEKEEFKAMLDANKSELTEVIKAEAKVAAETAVQSAIEALPEVKAGVNTHVEVVKDESEQPWKSKGEFFSAVKNAATSPHSIDPRLLPLKATGMNEAIPSQGGFLVPEQTAPGIIEKMYATGTLLSLFSNRDPVIGNAMTYNVVDETSRANGSRNGGISSYWGAEAGTKLASKPSFRQLELKLKKLYALCVATDELLEDAPALESWLTRTVPDEIRFRVEDSIINGVGVGEMNGILQSPALKVATRTDASEIDAFDIGRMWAARFAGVNDYVWLGNQSIFPQMLNLAIGQQPVFLPAGGMGGLPYATLLGRPYYDVEYLPALGAVGDLLLVSASQYQMIEKSGGIQYATSIHVYFTTDESAFRFVYRVDGAPIWNSVLTGKDGLTVSPFVALAATT